MSEISDEEIDRQLNKFFAEKGDFGSWIAKMKAICLTLRSERDEARRELGAHRERIKMQRERHITLTEQLAAKDAELAELKQNYQTLLDDSVFMRQLCAQHVQKIAQLSGQFGQTDPPKQLKPNMTHILPRGKPDPGPEGEWE